ncbi:MAG: GTPase Era [Gemmataceae bacterium]|nr:GTPase Era [Gemmataceae bacterium]
MNPTADTPAAPADSPDEQPPGPLLRTLAPLLRGLERQLRAWLDARRTYPLTMLQRAELEGVANDLGRQADALDVDKPLLVVMLMGGTGVGKSTLLNALAGSPIAQSSFTRPTTRDPVVYFHHSVRSDRLDPALRLCRLVQHDRPGLEQKVIVDTPDLDSNDLANREKLKALLPIADVVLYVGSQEKYHDQLGWDLFKEQRRRRAFAFVLNKWDRCVQVGETGLRPDEDLLKDLKAEGFQNPLLFRTNAQAWLDAANKTGPTNGLPSTPGDLPEGEQFPLLKNWLELGLTRLEIEAVKARGVGQLLAHITRSAGDVRPPDLSAEAERVRTAWEKTVGEEAGVQADVLVGTLEPYRTEVEHHFSVEGQQRFRGLMAAYLRLTTMVRYAGSRLRDRHPITGRLFGGKMETPVEWNLGAFVQDCARAAGERVLDQRTTALINRLLVEADQKGFPLGLLQEPTAAVGRLDWRERVTRGVIDALAEVEQQATHPTGWRRWLRGTLGFLANTLPEVSLVATAGIILWNFIVNQETPDLFRMLLIALVPLTVIVVFHLLILLLLPIRWPAIRGEFRTRLGRHLTAELGRVYLPVPGEIAAALQTERKQVETLVAETKQVGDWLADRQQAARVGELYGG